VSALGSRLTRVAYVGDDPDAITEALRGLTSGFGRVDVLLTAGAGSTDPEDPLFEGLTALGGRVISHGVPAHPGSMLIVARLGRVVILGLLTCGAYSKATAVDLLLPWLLSGEPPTRATVARLGHGGILTRDQRFRFPAYARKLEAPGG
jgi:molybdopterin biosynthesis enzyme